jgi:hypothetical protein
MKGCNWFDGDKVLRDKGYTTICIRVCDWFGGVRLPVMRATAIFTQGFAFMGRKGIPYAHEVVWGLT